MNSRPHEVWPFPGHPGFRRSMDGAGTVAAPLLAGFSFTLLVLVVPTFADERTTINRTGGVQVIRQHEAFSAAPELAALLLLLAGLMLVFSIQAAIFVRYYNHSPADLKEWYPQYFRQAAAAQPDAVEVPPDLENWDLPDAPAVRVGAQWYGGLMRKYLHDQIVLANRWARNMRLLYHLGILSLLSGLAVLVWPPSGQYSGIRVALAAVAVAGTAVEMAWILVASRETLRRWFARLRCSPKS
jgi:hypothetical protein